MVRSKFFISQLSNLRSQENQPPWGHTAIFAEDLKLTPKVELHLLPWSTEMWKLPWHCWLHSPLFKYGNRKSKQSLQSLVSGQGCGVLPLSPSCSLEIFFRSMKWVAKATSFTLPSSHTWIFTLLHRGGNISLKTTCSCHTGSAQFFCTVVRPWERDWKAGVKGRQVKTIY